MIDQINRLRDEYVRHWQRQDRDNELRVHAELRALGALQLYTPHQPRVHDEDSLDYQDEAEAQGVRVRDLVR